MSGRYDDILYRPHPEPTGRPRMSAQDRAAQFSPFSALTGYGAVIRETARQTEPKRLLGEDQQIELNQRLNLLLAHLEEHPEVALCYFQADEKKSGGTYLVRSGFVKKIDPCRRTLTLSDQTTIAIDDLWSLDGPLFASLL